VSAFEPDRRQSPPKPTQAELEAEKGTRLLWLIMTGLLLLYAVGLALILSPTTFGGG